MKVINFFAGPGAGKSTLAAELFVAMKRLGLAVDLVTEYAKDMVWERRDNVLDDQLYVFAKQRRRLIRLRESGVEWAVTDSPLLFSCLYGTTTPAFRALVQEMFDEFENVNFFVRRKKAYVELGRVHTETEAHTLDVRARRLCDMHEVNGDGTAVPEILRVLGLGNVG